MREYRRCKADPVHFLTKYVRTLDTRGDDRVVRLLPDKDYLREIVHNWRVRNILFVMKSRQIMATWTFVALNVWLAMFFNDQLIFFQSKREEDAVGEEAGAAGLLGRARFLINRLPGWLKPETEGPGNRLIFPATSSLIWAVPQGGDILRSHTASSVLSDEATSQPEFRAAYTSSRPTITGGGRFVALSSVKGRDSFWKLCQGNIQ